MSVTSEVAQYYDLVSDRYDLRFRNPFARRIDLLERTFIGRHIEAGTTVLEVGSGTGRVTSELVARGARVVAADCSAEMVRTVRRRFHPEVVIAEQVAISDLPRLRGYGQFDVVVCMRVLPHIQDISAALAILSGAVNPNGSLIFDLWNRHSLYVLTRRMFMRPSPVLTVYYTEAEMRRLISSARLSCLDHTAWGFPVGQRICLSLEMLGNRMASLVPGYFGRFAYSHIFVVRRNLSYPTECCE